MTEGVTIFEIMKTILLWLSPVLFLLSLFLLLIKEKRYNNLENTLSKEMGFLRKRLIPQIETNIYTFHKWLLKKMFLLCWFLVVYSAMVFIILRK